MSNLCKFATVVLLAIWSGQALALVSVTVDRTDIRAGESFNLDIRVDGAQEGEPDLAALPEGLRLLRQSRYQNHSLVNGQSQSVRGWKLELVADEPGTYALPPIAVGDDASRPLSLTINDAVDPVAGGDNTLLEIRASADVSEAYVQQQVIYSVRLYRAVQTKYASLTEPDLDQAVIEKLGDDHQFEITRNGVRYLVLERQYALFPQKSGELVIPPVTFSAEIPDTAKPRSDSIFGSFLSRTRPVTMKTEPVRIQVRPRPANAGDPWLPAKKISLEQSWQPESPEYTVGKPVTWTLTIRAEGVSESLLPRLDIAPTDGINFYRDQPQIKRSVSGAGVTSFHQEKIALVPTREGDISLPEIQLSWWNVITNEPEVARIPASRIQVEPGAAVSSMAPVEPVAPALDPALVSPLQVAPAATGYWQFAAWGFATLWLLTLGWLLMIQKARKSMPSTHTPAARPATRKAIRAACRANDPQATATALLAWCQSTPGGQDILTLDELAAHLDSTALKRALMDLERHRYGPAREPWSGTRLAALLPALKLRQRNSRAKPSPLPPLYAPNR